MELKTHHSVEVREGANSAAPTFAPLESVTRPTLTTAEAAYYLNRREQTLRIWASTERAPLLPRRVFGRLAWPTDAVRRLCGIGG